MADFAQLVLAVDARAVQAGETALNSLATTAERTEARTVQAMGDVSQSITRVGATAGGAGSQGLRNLGLQLGQVGQQGAATGNYLQALAIQMPDILMSFGMWGIGLGVVAGALVPLMNAMGSTEGLANRLEEAMDGLTRATRDARGAVDNLSVDSMAEDFGEVTAEVVRLRERMAELSRVELAVSANTAVQALLEMNGGIERLFNEAGNVMGYGLERATAALEAFGNARGFQQQAAAATEIVDAMRAAGFHLAEASESQRTAYRDAIQQEAALRMAAASAGDLSDAISGGADGTDRMAAGIAQLARDLGISLGLATALAGLGLSDNAESLSDDGRGSQRDEAASGREFNSARARSAAERRAAAYQARLDGTAGGGGGGASAAQRQQNEAMREAQRIYDATRTSAEQYAAELADLNELHQMGYLDAETYRRAVASLSENYDQAGESARQWAQDMAGHFDGLITGGRDFSDVLMSIARQLESQAWQQLFSGLFSGGGGSGGGGFMSFLSGLFSFDGGGSTGGGARVGGVDGKGGFMAIVHPNETVVDHSRGQSVGGGMAITVNVAGASGDQHIINLVRQGVGEGMRQMDAALPDQIRAYTQDPRGRRA